MREYHKINAPFKRDMAGDKKLILGDWALQEFDYLKECQWEFTEKVDGTNIRIYFERRSRGSMDGGFEFMGPFVGGRTDNAQIPPHLLVAIKEQFDNEFMLSSVRHMMESRGITSLMLYGEGYGPKIQGGGKYREDASFVLFDVQVGDTWLLRDAVDDIGEKLTIDTVPVIGYGTLYQGITLVANGYLYLGHDTMQNFSDPPGFLASRWGNFEAEGIVARPKIPLFDRQGKRIITKIKAVDFRASVGQK